MIFESPFIRWHKNRWQPEFTRFWIVRHTPLHKAIARLEAQGAIHWWEQRLKTSKKLQSALHQLHKKEIHLRKNFLTHWRNWMKKHQWDYLISALEDENIGLGGIRNWQHSHTIKCLHLWSAYHLCDERFQNPIGEWVMQQIGL